MSRHSRYLQFLTALLPAGAFGLSVALASSAAKATPTPEADKPSTDNGSNNRSVAAELQAIRDAVDEANAEIQGGEGGRVGQIDDSNVRLAFWLNGNGRGWGNGGRRWGNGGWPAWGNGGRVWGNGWGNGGWGNGPWHNGGWHNWRNWRN